MAPSRDVEVALLPALPSSSCDLGPQTHLRQKHFVRSHHPFLPDPELSHFGNLMRVMISIKGSRLVLTLNDLNRKRALQIVGSNLRKSGEVTLPLNLMSFAAVSRAFPQSRFEWSEELIEWRQRELDIIEVGAAVNDRSLQVWDMPDLWEWQAQAIARIRLGSTALFDDRGMGKTRCIVEAIRESQAAGDRKALVVTSKRLRNVWMRDTAAWWDATASCAPSGRVWSEAVGEIGSAPITILTYDSILNDDIVQGIYDLDPYWIVLEEAHNLKARFGAKSEAMRSLPGVHRIALTGTPMPNRWHEVWSLLNFVAPEVFTSFWQFVEALGEVNISFWGGKEISEDIVDTETWKEIFDRWIVMRHRSGHGKIWDFVPVTLSKPERVAYRAMQKDMRSEKDNGEVLDASTILAKLTRLQQLAGGLGKWSTTLDETGRQTSSYLHGNPSSKIDTLLELVQGIKRAVVFTRFRNRAEFVADRIVAEGIAEPLLITGAISEAETYRRLARFAGGEDSPLVAICVYGTISEGVNELVSARDIFFLDWTTVKDVAQAADRLDRPGQTDLVRCVTLYSEGTIDELAIDRERNKVRPLRDILRSPEGWGFLLDEDD